MSWRKLFGIGGLKFYSKVKFLILTAPVAFFQFDCCVINLKLAWNFERPFYFLLLSTISTSNLLISLSSFSRTVILAMSPVFNILSTVSGMNIPYKSHILKFFSGLTFKFSLCCTLYWWNSCSKRS